MFHQIALQMEEKRNAGSFTQTDFHSESFQASVGNVGWYKEY